MRLMALATALILTAGSAAAQPGCIDDWRDDNCPIVINFEGNYELTGAESPVRFDILATGDPILIGWTAVGGDEAFLCRDRDQNGTIDDGSELFGNAVMLGRRHARAQRIHRTHHRRRQLRCHDRCPRPDLVGTATLARRQP